MRSEMNERCAQNHFELDSLWSLLCKWIVEQLTQMSNGIFSSKQMILFVHNFFVGVFHSLRRCENASLRRWTAIILFVSLAHLFFSCQFFRFFFFFLLDGRDVCDNFFIVCVCLQIHRFSFVACFLLLCLFRLHFYHCSFFFSPLSSHCSSMVITCRFQQYRW